MEWIKRYAQLRHFWQQYNIFRSHGWRPLVSGDHNPRRRSCRNNRRFRNYRIHFYHYLALYLLAVTPAYAEDPKVQNTSNPVAAATGNVTNQAVQFQNNGAPSRQIFGPNSSCNGATMTFSPFYMGNDTIPYEADGYVRSNNYGMQMSFMIPLDGGMTELCKQIANRHEQKMRLEYELARALKCTEIMKAGFTFRPGSRVEVLCHDIIPIVSINGSSSKSDSSDNSGGSSTEQQTAQPNQ